MSAASLSKTDAPKVFHRCDSARVQAKVGDILFAVNKESLFPCNGSILRLKELKDKGDGKPIEYGFLRIRTIAQNAISYSSLNK
ncbi:hypothetical protein TrLO_g10118 [Triparma laevis f. longispina]|uniref:Uncharacterized protein n=1 Tax=Triparma laevis f. longispina TaxID=1714387 RepID=A0A9W7AC12_9STRA|nr:hypothetical protein TrLO_g10118 [Triparma laevis f. longispina]